MKLIVCMKQVPAAATAGIDPVTKTIVRTAENSVTNPFDLHALQTALDLRSRAGGSITAITMGIQSAERVLRDAVSRGADSGVLLSDRAFAGADTLATSYALSLGIQKLGGADLIVCGRMAVDGDTAQIGPELAQQLGIHHASDVCEVVEASEAEIVVRRVWDDLEQVLRLPLPALITVTKGRSTPALASIAGMLRGRDIQIPVWTAASLGADEGRCGLRGSPTQVVRTFTPPSRGGARRICGDAARQAAEIARICGEVLHGKN